MFIEVECVCLHSATHGITFYDLSYLAGDKHKRSPSGGGERGNKKKKINELLDIKLCIK